MAAPVSSEHDESLGLEKGFDLDLPTPPELEKPDPVPKPKRTAASARVCQRQAKLPNPKGAKRELDKS